MTRLLCFALIALALPAAAGAQEAATAIASPAARQGDGLGCRVLSPRYEPKHRAQVETPAHFQGGAKLVLPVAAPCPRHVSGQEV
jgi:hypothetical protein